MIKEKEKAEKLGAKFLELFKDEIKNENKYSYLLFIDYGDAYYKQASSNFGTELEVISNEFMGLLKKIDTQLELSDNYNHHYCLEKVSNTLEIIKNKLKQSVERKGIHD